MAVPNGIPRHIPRGTSTRIQSVTGIVLLCDRTDGEGESIDAIAVTSEGDAAIVGIALVIATG